MMSFPRPTVSSVVLASACSVAIGGCGSSIAGVVIPRGARVVTMTSAAGLEPPSVSATVTAPDQVRQITAWIDRMKPVPAGVSYSCPETAGVEPTVSLTFRATLIGRALASASEADPGYGSSPCNPLTVTIPGEGKRQLVAGMFLEHIERLTGVEFGFGFGSIIGAASYAGGARLRRGSLRLFPGGAAAYLVNVYLARPRAFPGYGNGLLIGDSIDRRGQFNIRIAPGTYRLEAVKSGQQSDCPPTTVTVRVDRTTHADVLLACRLK